MSNFDDLKRENHSDDRLEAVYQKVDAEVKDTRKKPTVFSLVLATLKRDNNFFERSDLRTKPPMLNATVLTFFMLLAASLVLVLCYFFFDKIVLVPMTLVFSPLFVPLILIVFYYEMNADKSVSVVAVFLSFIFGLLMYITITFLNRNFLYNITFYSDAERYIFPIIYSSLLFLITFLLTSIFKAGSLTAFFLVAVSVSLSYYYISTVVNVFNDLFVRINTDSIVRAIVASEESLTLSFNSIFSDWIYDFIFYPLLYSFWAVIIGSVVSVSASRRDGQKRLSRSTYFLLIVLLFSEFTVSISTTIALLDHVLKILSFIVSMYVSVRMINKALNS